MSEHASSVDIDDAPKDDDDEVPKPLDSRLTAIGSGGRFETRAFRPVKPEVPAVESVTSRSAVDSDKQPRLTAAVRSDASSLVPTSVRYQPIDDADGE